MKMTTPVLSVGEGGGREMSFVLPSEYWEEEGNAPKPLSDSAMKVSSVGGCDRACWRSPASGGRRTSKTDPTSCKRY